MVISNDGLIDKIMVSDLGSGKHFIIDLTEVSYTHRMTGLEYSRSRIKTSDIDERAKHQVKVQIASKILDNITVIKRENLYSDNVEFEARIKVVDWLSSSEKAERDNEKLLLKVYNLKMDLENLNKNNANLGWLISKFFHVLWNRILKKVKNEK